MEVEKRKRQDDGGANGKRAKQPEDEDRVAAAAPVPADEEVDEFFAILKRIQVAVKYFQRRDGAVRSADSESMAKPPWRPSFEREDFDGVKKDLECSEENQKAGLDLNSDPASDVSDAA